MADQTSNNDCGRGLPPYLLWRQDSGSSIYSDGASRIFLSSHSVTSDKDTNYSCASINSDNLSSVSSWLTSSECYSTKTNENYSQSGISMGCSTYSVPPLGSSNFLSPNTLSARVGFGETKMTENFTHSMKKNDQATQSFTASIKSGSSITLSRPPIGPARDGAEKSNCDFSGYGIYPNTCSTYTDPENMFTPYVPLLTEAQGSESDNFLG